MMVRSRIWTLGALMAGDLLSTALILSIGGQEMNPIVLALGWPAVVLLKASIVLLLAAYAEHSPRGVPILNLMLIFMAAVVLWNVGVLIRAL